ncbi:hypothetical protein [Actinomadura sp. BRA 177]|uniref:hypothetical protein n=1 Tax=Actinomadura sp. BRA 177 TaxID=2745202 RepID=UPI0015959499|nr:hypothetical protein [Actinomadura sp. BRA 177]NVI86822.1 hypothetical protein [Actinomadura sp. BRA 177]
MLALLLVVGLVVTVTILAVGVVLYGTLGFVGWALIVVGLGAALQFGLRRRGMLHRQDRERRSFLRLYPPLLVAIALVAMAIVVNIGPPALVLVPPAIVMMCSTAWQRRAASKDETDRPPSR